jgi:hypothetical protein
MNQISGVFPTLGYTTIRESYDMIPSHGQRKVAQKENTMSKTIDHNLNRIMKILKFLTSMLKPRVPFRFIFLSPTLNVLRSLKLNGVGIEIV